jgi:hypothetical protein
MIGYTLRYLYDENKLVNTGRVSLILSNKTDANREFLQGQT